MQNYLLSCLSLSFLWSHSFLDVRFICHYLSWFCCFPCYSSGKHWEFPGLSLGSSVSLVKCHFLGWLSPWPHMPCQRVRSLEYFRSISFDCLSPFWLMSSFLYAFLSEVRIDTSSFAFTGSYYILPVIQVVFLVYSWQLRLPLDQTKIISELGNRFQMHVCISIFMSQEYSLFSNSYKILLSSFRVCKLFNPF